MAKDLTLAVKVRGDASELTTALGRAESDLQDLGKTASSIKVLESAVADIRHFEGELQGAQAKVRALQTALSEAYAADADAPLLKKLNSELANAERAATKAEAALTKSQTAVVKLNLEASKTGVSTGNMAQKSAELAAETTKVTAKIGELTGKLNTAAIAENNLTAGAKAVASAFATLNIRSAEKIKADILAVDQALVRLGGNAKVSGADFDRAYAGAQVRLATLRAELAGTEAAAGKTSTAVSGMGASLKGLVGVGAALAIGREFISANVAAESLERTLVQLTGSGSAAAAEIEYLKATSERLGLSINEASRAYVGLTAAARGTTLEGAGTRRIFEAVAGSMSKLGKSSADTESALQAVSQMMSKGVVSMEEWRQQLGERLPGAANATAKAIGITVEQMNKMIESGKVLPADLLLVMADAMDKLYGTAEKSDGAVAGWNRLKNSIAETMTFVGNTGVWSGTVRFLEWMGLAVRGLTTHIDLLGRTYGNFAGFITTVWSDPKAALENFVEEQKRAFDETYGNFSRTQKAAEGAAAAQKKQADAARVGTAADVEASRVKLLLAQTYDDLANAAKDDAERAVKSAAARAEEGKASVDLASSLGSESEKRIAGLNAAKGDAETLDAVAAARRREADISRAYVEILKELSGEESKRTEAQKKAIAEEEKRAALLTAEAARAEAESNRAQVRAAQLATETAALKDNSASIGELKAAADAATVALENMRRARAVDAASDKDVNAAKIAAAQAVALYRDALNDQTKALEYNATIKAKETDLKSAGLRLEIEQLKSMAAVAKAYGDEGAAAAYLLQIKQLEIELAELLAQAKRAEAEAALTIIRAKRAEIQASGELAVEKERELRAQELSAQVKLKEAEIAEVTADKMRQLADATELSGIASENAAPGYERLSDSINKTADATRRLREEQDGVRSVQGPVTVQDGPRVTKMTGIGGDFSEQIYKRGASVEEKKLAEKYVGELYARNQATMLTGNLGNSSNAYAMQQRAINDAVDKAIAAARKELATGQATNLGTSVGDIMQKNLSKSPLTSFDDMSSRIQRAGAEASNQTIKVDLRTGTSKTTSINVASQQDAASLIEILKTLQARAA